MLLHGLSGGKNDTLFNQFVFEIMDELDPEAFRNAWNQVVASHTALRTAFIWKGVETPQQVVRQKVDVGCEVLDFRGHSKEQQETEIARVLSEDRKSGFDFRRAPLMRFTLIRLDTEIWRMVWSSHHLILDRWCIDVLFGQFQQCYRAFRISQPVAPIKAPSYRDYIGWIRQQDRRATLQYWAHYLEGFNRPTTARQLLECQAVRDCEKVSHAICAMGAERTRQAREFAARLGVTFSCVVQASLALAVNQLLQKQDVVFGITVSGRPAALAHVEEIVGSFISSIPVRVKLSGSTRVGQWLRDLNSVQFASAGRDYLSPAQLRACTSLTTEQPLFDVLMVWLGQTALEASTTGLDGTLPLVAMSEQYATRYPITLSMIEEPDELVLRADAASSQLQPLQPLLDAIVRSLDSLLEATAENSLDQLSGIILTAHSDSPDEKASTTPFAIANDTVVPATGAGTGAGREEVRLDLMEELLCAEWQRLLGCERVIAAENDFFEMGGDSLKAAALHSRIEAATRKAVPLLALFEQSTLGGMARTLVNEQWPLRAGIAIPLQLKGSGPVLFCVASPEVNTLGYAMLTRHLPEEQNTVLLQAPPASDELEQMHPDELPEYAARYVKALLDVQPEGPYSLLSMCSGSHIALAMIRQLEAQGDEVQFAGVINTWSLYSISWKFYVNRLINVSGYYSQRIKQMRTDRLSRSSATNAALAVDSAVGSSAVETNTTLNVLPADSAVGLDNPWIRQVGFANRMPKSQSVNAMISVFRLARQPFWRIDDSALGWGRLAGHATTIDVDGDDHDSILREPNVQHFAERLTSALAQSVGGPPNGRSHGGESDPR